MGLKPGYKKTDVGVIPQEWGVTQLGALGHTYGGLTGKTKADFGTGSARYVTFLNVMNDVILDPARFESVRVGADEQQNRVEAGDLLFNGSSETPEEVGMCAILLEEYPDLYLNSFCFGFRLSPAAPADGLYLTYFFRSGEGRRRVYFLSQGATRYNLSKTALKALRLPLPPPAEQHAIAGALEDVDALLDGLTQVLAKKRDLKQAAAQQLLTGQARLPGFSGEWELLRMAEKSDLRARIGWQGLTTAEYLPMGEYYLVTGTDLVAGRVNWASCSFVDASRYAQDKNIQLKPRDVLLTKDGTIGKVGFVDSQPGPATLNSGVFVIRPKGEAYDPLFFHYILTSRVFDDFLTKLQAGSTISHLYQKDFVNFSFRAPSLPEQIAVAAVLSDMDAEIASLEQRLDKTRHLKQGMMQELLTGRTRLV